MKKLPFCLVYTRQPELIRKANGFLHSSAEVIPISETQQLFFCLRQHDPALLLFDVLTPESDRVLGDIRREWPRTLVIALGEERTEPVLSAQKKGVFAVESMELPRLRFQNLLQMAFQHLGLLQENESLRKKLNGQKPTDDWAKSALNQALRERATVHEGLRSFTQFHDLETLLHRSLDWLNHSKGLGSLGIFLKEKSGGTFHLKSSLKCPKEIAYLSFNHHDPLVAWFQTHAMVLHRDTLSRLEDETLRLHLDKALKAFFAEAIIPLHGSEELLGWIIIGSGSAGQPLTSSDLVELNSITDQLSFVIEKCILQRKNEEERLHFEGILHALSCGILLFSREMEIIWLNHAGLAIFGTTMAGMTGKSPEALGTPLADFVRRSSLNPFEHSTMCWSPPQSKQKFLVEIHPSVKNGLFQNAFMLMQDVTSEILVQENDRKIHQAEMVARLASDLSAEIRGPLVAIKTFAQLLPERYNDLSFRKNFVGLVSHEVERLSQLSDEVRDVSIPGYGHIRQVDLRDILRESIQSAITLSGLQDGQIHSVIDSHPALLFGDSKALMECFTQMISTIIKGCAKDSMPAISITVSVKKDKKQGSLCTVTFAGKSTPFDQGRRFSPPGARAASLDLNETKRTIASHRGQIRVGDDGKTDHITVELPLEEPESK